MPWCALMLVDLNGKPLGWSEWIVPGSHSAERCAIYMEWRRNDKRYCQIHLQEIISYVSCSESSASKITHYGWPCPPRPHMWALSRAWTHMHVFFFPQSFQSSSFTRWGRAQATSPHFHRDAWICRCTFGGCAVTNYLGCHTRTDFAQVLYLFPSVISKQTDYLIEPIQSFRLPAYLSGRIHVSCLRGEWAECRLALKRTRTLFHLLIQPHAGSRSSRRTGQKSHASSPLTRYSACSLIRCSFKSERYIYTVLFPSNLVALHTVRKSLYGSQSIQRRCV